MSKKLEELQQLYASELFNQIATNVEKEAHNIINDLKSKIDIEYNGVVENKPLLINIGPVEKPTKKIVHSAFTDIIKVLQSQKAVRKNIMLVGEAGSGKTQLAADVADALNLQFYPMSVGLQTTKSDLLGFINAYGNYVTTPLREAFEKGGVLLLDEFDATHAGVVTIINSLLANGHCSFPDKVVKAHPQFVCIVACNTYGDGGDFNYIGRNDITDFEEEFTKCAKNNEFFIKALNAEEDFSNFDSLEAANKAILESWNKFVEISGKE